MLFSDLEAHSARIYSQSGEDGSLACLFDRIGAQTRYFVEFGAKDGVRDSNTANLRLHEGWKGLLMDGSRPDAAVDGGVVSDVTGARVQQAFVDVENINELFFRYGVPKQFDLLSIDIDGNDYWVWDALVDFRPRVVVIEYNIFFAPEERCTIPYDPSHRWDETAYHGASLGALRALGSRKGYELVYTDPYAPNAFFVTRDALPEGWSEVSAERAARWGEVAAPPDPKGRPWLSV